MTVADLKTSPARFSDANLREMNFRFRDPERSIDGLDRDRPDPTLGLEVVGYYDETPPGGRKANPNAEYVWCCHCQKPTHWRGYVIRDSKGTLFIIGAQNCGKDHYGVRFDSAETRFNNYLRRQSALERWDLVAATAASLRGEVEALLHCEPLKRIEKLRQDIVRASPVCARLLKMHAMKASPLLVHNRERNYAAERARQEKYDLALREFRHLTPMVKKERLEAGLAPVLDDAPIHRSWTEDLGHLEGGDFLINDMDVRSAAIELRKTLNEILAIARTGTNDISTSTLSRLTRGLCDQASTLFQRCVCLGFLELFFMPDNIRRLVKWSNGHSQFSIKAENGGIIIIAPQLGNDALIKMPMGTQLPPFDHFAHLDLAFD